MAKEPGLSRVTGAPRQGIFFAIYDTADRQRSVSRALTTYLINGVSLLQTKFRNRERYNASRVGP